VWWNGWTFANLVLLLANLLTYLIGSDKREEAIATKIIAKQFLRF